MTAVTPIVPGNSKEAFRPIKTGLIDVYVIPEDQINVRPGFNEARYVDPDWQNRIRLIADDMKANGYYRDRPLLVSVDADGKIWLSDGETRLSAYRLAKSEGWKAEGIPVINEVRGTSEEDRVFSIRNRNRGGAELTPLGEAMIVKRLLGMNVSEQTIARRMNYAPQKMESLLTLLEAPKEVQTMVATGQISASMAVATIKTEGNAAPAVLADAVAVAKTKGRTKALPKDAKPATARKPKDAPVVKEVEAPLSVVARIVFDKLPKSKRGLMTFEGCEAVIAEYRKMSK